MKVGPDPKTGSLLEEGNLDADTHRRMPREDRDTQGGHHVMAEAKTEVMPPLAASHGC